MLSLDPKDHEATHIYKILTSSIAPRPIALVSSQSKNGIDNLSPFSFFNMFGFNPPVVAFSPVNRGRDGSAKDTCKNIEQTKECVINVVTFDMQYQMNLSSGEYASDVNEFSKSGFTPLPSEKIKPKRVKESPVQMECKVMDIVKLGEGKGSGNLILCEVVQLHLAKQYVDEHGIPKPLALNLIGRHGAGFYTKNNAKSMYELSVEKGALGIGFDALPAFIKQSKTLTANQLGQLASVAELPKQNLKNCTPQNDFEKQVLMLFNTQNLTHENADGFIAQAIYQSNIAFAWRILNALA